MSVPILAEPSARFRAERWSNADTQRITTIVSIGVVFVLLELWIPTAVRLWYVTHPTIKVLHHKFTAPKPPWWARYQEAIQIAVLVVSVTTAMVVAHPRRRSTPLRSFANDSSVKETA